MLQENHRDFLWLPWDIGGAKEPGMMYFPTKWGAKEPHNPQNDRVVGARHLLSFYVPLWHNGRRWTDPSIPRTQKTLGKLELFHRWQEHSMCTYNIYICIPRTQMTLVLIQLGLVLEGWPSKMEVSWVLGIHNISMCKASISVLVPTPTAVDMPLMTFDSDQSCQSNMDCWVMSQYDRTSTKIQGKHNMNKQHRIHMYAHCECWAIWIWIDLMNQFQLLLREVVLKIHFRYPVGQSHGENNRGIIQFPLTDTRYQVGEYWSWMSGMYINPLYLKLEVYAICTISRWWFQDLFLPLLWEIMQFDK